MIDLTPISNLAMAYAGNAYGIQKFKDVHTPRMWLNEGCDMQKDILPVMDRIMRFNGLVKSYAYFTHDIHAARDLRLAKEKAEQPDTPEKIAARVKHYAWLRDNRPHLLRPEWMDQLNNYERSQGPEAA